MAYKEIPGPIEGYKIFNQDMTCRGFQFKIGEVNELGNSDPLVLCENGFHFCKYPSGVWSYYQVGRVFKVRGYDVLDVPTTPGADYKMCCRKIEILEEIFPGGNLNTGNGNTGDRNTGDLNTGNGNTGNGNTGNRNTGDGNTGDLNTGNLNTGNRNTGNRNTGHRNTGDRNTGDRNTGDRNTGDWNTGDWNTGDWNTGDWNTGDWNAGSRHSGYFGIGLAPVVFFGKPVKDPDSINWGLACQLGEALASDVPFDPTPYLTLPNATKAYIKRLHKAHIEGRKKASRK